MELDRYRKILVGTDGSSLAGPTVTRAARLAVADDADLIVVCAYTKMLAREAAREPNLEGSVATLGQVPGSARDHRVDATVLGAIRDTSVVGRLLGNVSSAVVRRAHRDVLVVRPVEGSEEPNVAEDVEIAPTSED